MRSLINSRDKLEIEDRLKKFNYDNPRQWGQMTAHQMICHLRDSFMAVMGERKVSSRRSPLERTFIKVIALYAPMRWPQGYRTMPEIDQLIGGTKPVTFDQDKTELLDLFQRFTTTNRDFEFKPHPFFGTMSEWQWMRWGYLHADHHLRQFNG
jgi:hypothetical protein